MFTKSRHIKAFLFRHKAWVFVVVLSTLTFGVYFQVIRFDFVNFDDDTYVTENEVVQKGLTTEGLRYAFDVTSQNKAYWQPLTWLSHMLDCQLFGIKAVDPKGWTA